MEDSAASSLLREPFLPVSPRPGSALQAPVVSTASASLRPPLLFLPPFSPQVFPGSGWPPSPFSPQSWIAVASSSDAIRAPFRILADPHDVPGQLLTPGPGFKVRGRPRRSLRFAAARQYSRGVVPSLSPRLPCKVLFSASSARPSCPAPPPSGLLTPSPGFQSRAGLTSALSPPLFHSFASIISGSARPSSDFPFRSRGGCCLLLRCDPDVFSGSLRLLATCRGTSLLQVPAFVPA